MMDTTEMPAARLIQPGWTVLSRDGAVLGEVLGADERRFLLRDGDHPTRRLELSIDLIAELEPADMRARLDIDESQTTADHPSIVRVPRAGSEQA